MNDNELPPSIARWVIFLAGLIAWAACVGIIYLGGAFVYYDWDPANWNPGARFLCAALAVFALAWVADSLSDDDDTNAGEE